MGRVAGSVSTACGPLPTWEAAGRRRQPDPFEALQVAELIADIVSSWLFTTNTVCTSGSMVRAHGLNPTGTVAVGWPQPECRRALQVAVLITETVESVLLAV